MSARWGGPEPVDESWPAAIRALVLALAIGLGFLLFVAITAVDPVDAASPGDRCDACRLGTPRPVPTVVGITPRPEPTVSVPQLLPDTDTLP